jgi:nitrogen fixation protein FixH
MRFNWGHGIATFFVIFVAIMLSVLFYSRTKTEDLVTENYYDEELKYQDRIDEIHQAAALGELLIEKQDGALKIALPDTLLQKGMAKGRAHLYRPSDARLDLIAEFNPSDSGKVSFPLDKIAGGMFTLKVYATATDSTKYYWEKALTF